jgi:hypothetical protein
VASMASVGLRPNRPAIRHPSRPGKCLVDPLAVRQVCELGASAAPR